MKLFNLFKIILLLGIGLNLSFVLAETNKTLEKTIQTEDQQQEQSFKVLSNMIYQINNSSYQLVFSLSSSSGTINYNYIHSSINNSPIAEIYNLDGVKNTIILKNGIVSYIESAESIKANKITDVLPNIFSLDNVDQIKKYYTFTKIGEERVTNQNADVYLLKNKYDSTYQLTITIDPATSLPLHIIKHDDYNNFIQSFTVISLVNSVNTDWVNKILNFSPIQESLTRNTNLTNNTVNPKYNKSLSDSIKLSWLPEGFNLISNGIVNIENPTDNQEYFSFFYSDNVFSFTMYFDPKFKGSSHYHLDNGMTNIYANSFENREIIIFGELPLTTYKKIINNISILENGKEIQIDHPTGYGRQLQFN